MNSNTFNTNKLDEEVVMIVMMRVPSIPSHRTKRMEGPSVPRKAQSCGA